MNASDILNIILEEIEEGELFVDCGSGYWKNLFSSEMTSDHTGVLTEKSTGKKFTITIEAK